MPSELTLNTDFSQLGVGASPKLFPSGDTAITLPTNSRSVITEQKAVSNPNTPNKETPKKDLEAVAQQFNEVSESLGISLQFKQDRDTGTTVISLVNATTGETVRQIPSEALLRLSAALGELQGNFVDQHV